MVTNDKIKKGKDGENLAAEFLIKKGFTVEERNYRHKRSEIDLIVKRDNWLVFVEVKARSSVAFGYPEEFVDHEKVKMVVAGAVEYMYRINWDGNVRYDIVSVQFKPDGPDIVHIEDAFY